MCSPRRGEDQLQDDRNGSQSQTGPHPEESPNPQKPQRPQKVIPEEEMVESIPKSNLEENPEQQSIGKALSLTSPSHPMKSSSRRKKGKSDIKEEQAGYEMVSTRKRMLHLIPFIPSKILDFLSHETLLKGLGVWEFVNTEFYQEVNADLITQLVDTYDPKLKRSFVNGLKIRVSKAYLGRTFGLPLKKRRCLRDVTLSEEIIEFLEDFVSIWVLLHEDTWVMPREVLNCMSMIRDGNPEKVDWAGLLWFMVERELTRGAELEDCYYAVHLQCLIKSQCGEVFIPQEPENLELDECEGQEQDKNALGGPDIDLSVGLLNLEKKEEVVDAEDQQEEEEEQWPSGRNDEEALMILDDQDDTREDCKNPVEEEVNKDDFHVLSNGDENSIERIEVGETVLSLFTTGKEGMMILDDQEESKDEMVDAEEEEEQCPSGRNYESFSRPGTGKGGMMISEDQEEKKEVYENLVGEEETKYASYVLANGDENLIPRIEVDEPVLSLCTTGKEGMMILDDQEENKDKLMDADEGEEQCPSGRNYESLLQSGTCKKGMTILDDQEEKKEAYERLVGEEETKDESHVLAKDGMMILDDQEGYENLVGEEDTKDQSHVLANGDGNLFQIMELNEPVLLLSTTGEEGALFLDHEEKNEESRGFLYKEGPGGECREEEEREDEFYALAGGSGNLQQRMESDKSLLQLGTTTREEGVTFIDLEEKKEEREYDERENNGNSLLKLEASQVPFNGEPHGSGCSKRWAEEHNNCTNKRLRADCVQQPLDFGTTMTEIQQLLSHAKMAKEAHDLRMEQQMLHRQTLTLECHKRDTIIASLKRAKFEEVQKREAVILRLERELSTMNNIMNGYRNALKGVKREFVQCRELARIRLKQEEERNAMSLVLKEKAKEAEEGYVVEFGMYEDKVIAMSIRLMNLSSKVDELKELWARHNVLKKGSADE
ncbi:hypothetical protein DM860_014701 [Cuscuta australis]|uniref:Uncharacterized protein n=1 Tax=Cuscuta australis TaxID=267555 RepID=A0A328DM59_9ASTE|nr:hypothetical protein DM860_014701 [Cuscuta australis]